LCGRGVVPGLVALGTTAVAGAVPPRLLARVLGLPGVASPAVILLARGALGMTTSSTRAIAAAVMGAALAAVVLAAPVDGPRVPASPGGSPSGPTGVLPGRRPAGPPENGTAGLLAKLHGFWNGGRDCQGDVTFKADGTYSWIHFGPGAATVAGKW